MSLEIAIASAEMYPYAKVGGLGDVVAALAKELDRMGHRVTVFLPRYAAFTTGKWKDLPFEARGTVEAWIGDRMERADLTTAVIPGSNVRLALIGHDGYYARENPYVDPRTGRDWPDNDRRFVFFSKAVLDAMETLDYSPDVLHLNDYQTGLMAAILRETLKGRPRYDRMGTLYSIHNMGYQGVFGREILPLLGLDQSLAAPMGPLEFYDKINFMKAGIVYADLVNTVSERYAEEIQSTAEHGFGLEGVLRARRADLLGILNGIDTEVWNPSTDKLIPFNYDGSDLEGKAANKIRLLETMELPVEPQVPLIGVISRLVSQKGFDLLEMIAGDLMGERLKLVVLGTGEPRFQQLMERLRERYPQKFSVSLEFNDALAHLIEAGSDFFLMPSKYEPCGLNQMYSLRYGTIPIVRATGGLADTVHDYNPETGKGNGFVFEEYTGEALLKAIRRGLDAYERRNSWRKLVREAMEIDHSWRSAAQRYVEVYERIKARRA
ncbi:MAG: glycogen synthase GlgA [Candidatus Eisenbacteria bacterium]|nr:glycogen synthase GlgA [Candidatus Eisenbacteria bacterium]MCC7143116.1 glycogen synthase GlgA [Candidatus Eisenbacteria bacterium]